jgi:2-polyprenyl-3-methyl-5-hydroxy-6-metoxy-1,4-benzoquinol methylase
MPVPDLDYLRRVGSGGPAALLREPKFLAAQELFFEVVTALDGSVDFDVADMREVHAVAALGDVHGVRVLDVGCGSTEEYVLEDTFRDRYPPFFAEMLTQHGALVTGVDIRMNPTAGYDHRVLDCTERDWAAGLEGPYDVVACLSLFNAPGSPFESDAALCDRLLQEMRALVKPGGLLIVTLRDDQKNAKAYAEAQGLTVLHCDKNCGWFTVPAARA